MIIDSIHKRFPYLKDARTREIRVDKQLRKVFCTISFPKLSALKDEDRKNVTDYVKTLIPQGYSCQLFFVNDFFTEESFRAVLEKIIKKDYPIFKFIKKNKISVKLDSASVSVTFTVDKITKQNMEVANLSKRLTEYFRNYTCYDVRFGIEIDEEDISVISKSEQEKLVYLAINKELFKPARHFAVSSVVKYIGKEIPAAPMYISDVRNAMDSCVLCGRISGKSIKESKNNPNMQVCKFNLTDESQASIPCVLFVKFQISDVKTIKDTTDKSDSEVKTLSEKAKLANEKKMDKLLKLYDGTEVLVRGKISFNNFSERLEMVVYDVCKCKIESISSTSVDSRPVPQSYLILKPETYTEFLQTSFVAGEGAESVLKDKSYVVIHVNATGYNVTKDKIIALCAVKIVNGGISSKLFTYINPDSAVSSNVLNDAQITAEQLVFYPTLTEVISDLYKFMHGSVLVGLNLERIVELLNYYAAPVGYRFGNELSDQSEMLSKLFDTSLFDKKPNCSKYSELSKTCRIPAPTSYEFCGVTAVTVAKCLRIVAIKQKKGTAS